MIGHGVAMLSENDAPQHSLKHLSQSQKDVAGLVVKVLGLSTSVVSNHRMLVVGTGPTQILPYHHLYLFG
jgi:hypothetical protein